MDGIPINEIVNVIILVVLLVQSIRLRRIGYAIARIRMTTNNLYNMELNK